MLPGCAHTHTPAPAPASDQRLFIYACVKATSVTRAFSTFGWALIIRPNGAATRPRPLGGSQQGSPGLDPAPNRVLVLRGEKGQSGAPHPRKRRINDPVKNFCKSFLCSEKSFPLIMGRIKVHQARSHNHLFHLLTQTKTDNMFLEMVNWFKPPWLRKLLQNEPSLNRIV